VNLQELQVRCSSNNAAGASFSTRILVDGLGGLLRAEEEGADDRCDGIHLNVESFRSESEVECEEEACEGC
jgi:hypothetical protein